MTSGEFVGCALLDIWGDDRLDLATASPGTTRLDVTDNVLALGRGNPTRLGGVEGAERGNKAAGLGDSGGDGKGTVGGGPLDVLVTLDTESLGFLVGVFGATLKLDAEYVDSLALEVSVSLPEALVVWR